MSVPVDDAEITISDEAPVVSVFTVTNALEISPESSKIIPAVSMS